jgi:hypothetical protein
LTIPVTSEPGKAALEFPAVPAHEGKVLCLKFKAFLATEKPAGWGAYLGISLNGTPVGAAMPDGSERLVNRPGAMDSSEGKHDWWERSGNLRVFFGPGTGDMDSRLYSHREEGYWYVLNISDLASYVKIGVDNRIESSGPNKLVFTNTYALLNSGETATCKEARIEDVSIAYLPQEALDQIHASSIKLIPPISGKTLRGNDFSMTIADSGAMDVRVGEDRYVLTAGYSYPGASMGYHQFSWDNGTDSDWKTSLASTGKTDRIIVRGQSTRYGITRKITLQDGKVRVADTIENKTTNPLGMSVRYNVWTSDSFKRDQEYLSGVPDARAMDWCSANPTVFVKQSSSSLGLVCEDTVFRLQVSMSSRGNTAQYSTDHLGIEPGKSYTIEWTMYPSRDTDYFTFVNRVRRDWHVNYTIPGPFVFTDTDAVKGRKANLYAVHPFFLYADGGHLTKEETLAQEKLVVQQILARQPDAIPLGMVETNLVSLDRNKLPGASITTERKYGLELSKGETKLLENSPIYSPWADSWPRTADGRAVVDTYYAYKPNLMNMMAYPVIGNHQFDYMKWQIDFLMDKIGCKGIYMDQFDIGYNLKAVGRPDYSKWDGHTVDLDSHGEIAAKYTDATLAGASARAALVKHILGKGGIVVTNGHSCARETTGLPILSFTETEWACTDPQRLVETVEPMIVPDMAAGHLASPIGLGIRPTGIFKGNKYAEDHFAEIVHKWVITCLRNGILYYYYMSVIPSTGPGAGEYGLINYMFPFTPVELHSGWLVGKERTLTAISGKYVWNHPDKPVCLAFDLKGRRITPNVTMTNKGRTWAVDLKLSDWNETAVIMSSGEANRD